MIGYAQCVPSATNPDSDGDGIANVCDNDDDNDGILDCDENLLNRPIDELFKINGSASQIIDREAQLTPDLQFQSGQIWSYGKVDFTRNFSISFQAYLGTKNDDGADGVAIVFHNDPAAVNAVGANGDGIGARGIQNGIVLELDTFYNSWLTSESSSDHGQIWKSADQSPITTPVNLPNLEDGNWHTVIVNWNSLTSTLTYTVDGTLAGSYTGNVISNFFGGSSKVHFGYTASTGVINNQQRVRFPSSSACSLPFQLDTDGDGIPNQLDLDSDNDGCPDAIEGGASFTSSNLLNSSMPGGNVGATSGSYNQTITQNLGNTVNTTSTSANYGVPTVAGSGQTIGISQTANPVLAAGTASANQTISTGSTPTALALTGATGSIQWLVSTNNTTFTSISGATNTTYAPGALTATRYYRAIVTSAGGCTAISNTVTITVTTCTVSSLKPTVSSPLANSCPANFADLNGAFTSTLPAGAELLWFSNITHSGTPFTSVEVSQATSGTYYAFFYDAINNCYSNASNPVTVNITPCCPTFTAYSTTGWKAKVYDAPAGTDAWTQISSSTTFPTTSYSQVATFDYNVKAGTNDAFSIDFQTRATGLTPSNPQIQNYVGTQIYNNPAWPIGDPRINEDYAVLFSKTVVSGEAGTYKFDLTYGDDHIFIYKNGVKINQMDNAYSLFPFPNFANINLAVGDVISVLMVEEYEFNTEVKIFGDKNPNVQNIANTCPSTTANLNDAFLGGTAPGVSLVWFNNNSHTGTPLTATEIANAAAGTYYAFYYNGSGCYSAASNAVIVTINSCVCFKDPINNGTGTATKTGVTLLKRAGNNDPDNWPMTRKSGHIALESNTQGFVITRIAKADFGNITNPQEGMMVYDTTDKCLKIYSDNAWKCFNIPACP